MAGWKAAQANQKWLPWTDGGEGLAGQGAIDGAAEDVPGRAGLFVDEGVGVGAEGQGLVAETAIVDAGGAHVSGGGYDAAVQRRGSPRREEDHYRRPTYVVVDHGGLLQPEEGVGHRLTAKLHSRYTLHGAEAFVLGADEQEGRGVDVVVAGVGVAAVLAGEARVPGEYLAVRVVLAEVGPGDDRPWDLGESGAGELADDSLAEDLLPPAVGGPVVHDEVAVAEEAADAEGVDGVAHAAFEDDGGVAEGAEGDDDGLSADDVVDDLVPGHDLEGVGAGVVADLEGDHGLPVGEPVGVVGHRCELGVVDGRDAVSDLSEEDFGVVDGVLGEVGAPGIPAGGVGLSEVGGRVEFGSGDRRGRFQG